MAEYFQANRRVLALYGLEYRERMRLEMVEAFGGKCVECREDDPLVLVLDHIENDAKDDRAQNKHKGGYKLYMHLRRNGWPKGRHQLLCHNCNFRKEYMRRKNAVRQQQAG